MQEVMKKIRECGIVPVIVINDASKAVPLSKALLAGGIFVIEVTFRTAAAYESIVNISREVPEMLVGAGTILDMEQLDRAIEAGSQFIVSPGLDGAIVKAAHAKGIVILPGAVTPTEIMQGLKLGIQTFKFFPAESYGGLGAIKSLCAPFASIDFVPTGGVSLKNLPDYLNNNRIAAVGGSWMATADMIDRGDFEDITNQTQQAVSLLHSIRR